MKKFLILAICVFSIGCQKTEFYLNNEYYNNNSLIEINSNDFKNLEKDKKSFVVFIYQPNCITSYDFNDILIEFLNTYQMTFYKIPFSTIENTSISDYVKYFPSVIIYQNGKPITYLKANKKNDLIYYQSLQGFKKWFTKYVLLKEN